MVAILESKLEEAKEDNFNMVAWVATADAEVRFEAGKKVAALEQQVASLESKVTFTTAKLQDTDRAKLKAFHMVEEIQQKLVVEQKRREAKMRLEETRRRRHAMAASQSLSLSQQQLSQSQGSSQWPLPVEPTAVKDSHPTASTAVQTDSLGDGPASEREKFKRGYASVRRGMSCTNETHR